MIMQTEQPETKQIGETLVCAKNEILRRKKELGAEWVSCIVQDIDDALANVSIIQSVDASVASLLSEIARLRGALEKIDTWFCCKDENLHFGTAWDQMHEVTRAALTSTGDGTNE